VTRRFASAKLAGSGEDDTMQYLLMIYDNESEEVKDPAMLQEITAAHMRLGAELTQAGTIVAGQRLRPSDTATTIRTDSSTGAQSLHDGPYAETREQLAGFYMIEAADLDEAIGWARKIPGAPGHAVEVRPIWPMG
jgi:hypothetical protein